LFENKPSGNPDPWHGFLLQTSFCFHSFCVKKFRTFFQRRSGNLAKITKGPLCVKSQSVAMGSFVDAKQGSQMQHRSKQGLLRLCFEKERSAFESLFGYFRAR
jgi:hypothetical protein